MKVSMFTIWCQSTFNVCEPAKTPTYHSPLRGATEAAASPKRTRYVRMHREERRRTSQSNDSAGGFHDAVNFVYRLVTCPSSLHWELLSHFNDF